MSAWLTIEAETLTNLADVYVKSIDGGIMITDVGKGTINNIRWFSTGEKRADICLALIDPTKIGFDEDFCSGDIFHRIKKCFRLELCPAKVGPELVVQKQKFLERILPINQELIIAMEGVQDTGQIPMMFCIRRLESCIQLDACSCEPSRIWSPKKGWWIFVVGNP